MTVLPYFVVSLVLVDLPFLAAILIFGWQHPVGTVEAWYGWRSAHAWTYALSVPVALMLAWRWWGRG